MTDTSLGGLDTELVSRTLLDAAEIAAEHTLPRFRSVQMYAARRSFSS